MLSFLIFCTLICMIESCTFDSRCTCIVSTMRCTGCEFTFPYIYGIKNLFVECERGLALNDLSNLIDLRKLYINDCSAVDEYLEIGYELRSDCEVTR